MSNLLSVVIMVKNEESNIVQTLIPFIPYVNDYLIADTGSTDKTIEVSTNFFSENNLNGKVVEIPFIDFETTRNQVLEISKNEFPKNKFILMLDAEWYFKNVEGLLYFCSKNLNSSADFYDINLISGDILFTHSRLITVNGNARFFSSPHEYVFGKSGGRLPSNIFIEHCPNVLGIKKTRKRFQEDLIKLFKQYYSIKKDARNVFYLAQTYDCLGMNFESIKYYLERITLGGFDEEIYYSYYAIANIYRKLNEIHLSLEYYLMAYNFRPTRIEALIEIAEYYSLNEKRALQYLYAKIAINVPFPENDVLFINHQYHNYQSHYLLTTSAFASGDPERYKMGVISAEKCLLKYPENQLLRKYLNKYQAAVLMEENGCKIDNRISFEEPLFVDEKHILISEIKNITIAILAKDKEIVLPTFLECLLKLKYPKEHILLYIRTNNNNDNTEKILKEWLKIHKEKYLKIYFDNSNVDENVQQFSPHQWNPTRFKVLANIRQKSVEWALQNESHYFVIDCDNFIHSDTLNELINTKLPIVAPLLHTLCDENFDYSHLRYSNYHADIDHRGYYKNCKLYNDIFDQKIKNLFQVPVVHCTYFIRYDILEKVSYFENQINEDHEYVIFSKNLRKDKIPQYLNNRQIFGYLTFAEKNEDFERFKEKLYWL